MQVEVRQKKVVWIRAVERERAWSYISLEEGPGQSMGCVGEGQVSRRKKRTDAVLCTGKGRMEEKPTCWARSKVHFYPRYGANMFWRSCWEVKLLGSKAVGKNHTSSQQEVGDVLLQESCTGHCGTQCDVSSVAL